MEGTKFFDGQDVLLGDINNLQSSLETQLLNRTSEILSPGLINASGNYVTAGTTANTIKVIANTAYDSTGNRIYIAADQNNLAPIPATGVLSSSGGAWTVSIRYIVVERYVETEDTTVAHPITGVLNNTRKHDSYTLIALRRSGATIDPILSTDVKLGRVDVSGAGALTITVNSVDPDEAFLLTNYLSLAPTKSSITVSGSGSRPATYAVGETKTLADHINAVGTGTPSNTNSHGLVISDLGTVDTTDIANLAVTAGKLATDAVTTTKILDANVTGAKIASGTITVANMAADSVGASQIVAGAVGNSELASGAVDSAKLATDAVVTAAILDANVTLAKLDAGTQALIATSAQLGGNQTFTGTNAFTQAITGTSLTLSGALSTVSWATQTLAAVGSVTLGSLIIKWGYYDRTGSTADGTIFTINYATAFPNACIAFLTTEKTTNAAAGKCMSFSAVTVSSSVATVRLNNVGSVEIEANFYWVAIGY